MGSTTGRARRRGLPALMIALAVLVTGCTSAVSGTAMKIGAATVDPGPSAEGPNGAKAGVAPADLKVTGDANTEWDVQAKNTLADLEAFYTQVLPENFPGTTFKGPDELFSYDSEDSSASACGRDLYGEANAAYDPSCNSIMWDRGVLLPRMAEEVGDLAAPTILAHEMGHLVQYLLGTTFDGETVIMLEQQADCYAGAYWRWVADGNSTYYDLNQGVGMREVLTAMMWTGDPVGMTASAEQAHGSGFDRSLAFSLGYANGVKRCDEIDQAEVDQRITEAGFTVIPKDFGNVDITEDFIDAVAETLNLYFEEILGATYQAPTLTTFEGTTGPDCNGTPGTFPVSYCGSTNTVSYNLAELQRIGTPNAGFASTNGDFSAVVLLASRYALAAQNPGGQNPLGNQAGLRALCYSGAWASWMKEPRGPQNLALNPTDLNKAVYQVMESPLAASDTAGKTSTFVIDQVQALYIGVVQGATECYDFYAA
ncbi:neutral zinc metallopeptidase [Nakamurella alba]|uniref:neutral zinc metallopeptidase n=1 Tax=Nakamurella alba TaxID=2665158 RepID=UPI0018A89890|nr:neutral zinc metallopeptidase [Nakamurella alba]